MPKGAYILYEAAAGYALFEVIEAEEIGAKVPEVEEAINDLKLFSKFVKYVSFVPFKDAQDALSNINDVSEGIVNDTLKDFLELPEIVNFVFFFSIFHPLIFINNVSC